MTRRRRPLLQEEKDRRSLRQVSTGRGQANARPLALSLARTRTQRPAGAGLSDLGFWRIDADDFVGTTLGSGLTVIAPDGVETNSLIDPAWVSYDTGIFHVVAAGLWVIQCTLRVDSTPDGYMYLQTARSSFGDDGPYIPFVSGGGEIIAGDSSQPTVSFGDDYWTAETVLDSSGPVVTSAFVTIYPVAIF